MIADMLSIKTIKPVVTELFIGGKKLKNSFFLSITQSYFVAPKHIRLSSTHYFIMEMPNRRDLSNLAIHQILTLETS